MGALARPVPRIPPPLAAAVSAARASEPMFLREPAFSDEGLALMSLHLGMWRSAACSLKRREQWGHCTREESGADGTASGMGPPVASACVTALKEQQRRRQDKRKDEVRKVAHRGELERNNHSIVGCPQAKHITHLCIMHSTNTHEERKHTHLALFMASRNALDWSFHFDFLAAASAAALARASASFAFLPNTNSAASVPATRAFLVSNTLRTFPHAFEWAVSAFAVILRPHCWHSTSSCGGACSPNGSSTGGPAAAPPGLA